MLNKSREFVEKYADRIFLFFVAIGVALVMLAITGCSPQARVNRILKKHPELLVTDTVTFKDTIYIASHSVDTLFSNTIDTIIVQDSTMKITYIKLNEKVYLKGEIKERLVPVVKTVEVRVPAKTITTIKHPWYEKFLIWWFILTIIGIVARLTIFVIKAKLPLKI